MGTGKLYVKREQHDYEHTDSSKHMPGDLICPSSLTVFIMTLDENDNPVGKSCPKGPFLIPDVL